MDKPFGNRVGRQITFNIPDIHVHLHGLSGDAETLGRIEKNLSTLAAAAALALKNEGRIMKSIDDIISNGQKTLDEIHNTSSVEDSIIALVQSQGAQLGTLKAQIDAMSASGTTDPTKLQQLSDMVDAMMQAETANAQKVANAVASNTELSQAGQNALQAGQPARSQDANTAPVATLNNAGIDPNAPNPNNPPQSNVIADNSTSKT